MLSLYDPLTRNAIYIWCYEDKEKNMMIIVSDEQVKHNLYMQSDRDMALYFSKTNFNKAINYSLNQLNKFLDKDLNIKI